MRLNNKTGFWLKQMMPDGNSILQGSPSSLAEADLIVRAKELGWCHLENLVNGELWSNKTGRWNKIDWVWDPDKKSGTEVIKPL